MALDVDAFAFLTAANISDTTQRAAIDTLVKGLSNHTRKTSVTELENHLMC